MTKDEWNARYPVGTRVKILPPHGKGEFRLTRGEAFDLPYVKIPCVLVTGYDYGIPLRSLKAEPENKEVAGD